MKCNSINEMKTTILSLTFNLQSRTLESIPLKIIRHDTTNRIPTKCSGF